MASRSDRMYSDSPKSERGDDGKVKVTRKSDGKRDAKPDMGDMRARHLREIEEMHKRHMDEHKAIAQRQEKEQAAGAQPPDAGAAPPAA